MTANTANSSETMTARTLTAPNGKTVTTSLRWGQAVRLLASHTSDFAAKLTAKLNAGETLTQNQGVYVYILAEEIRAKTLIESAAPSSSSAPSLKPIVDMYAARRDAGAKTFKVRLLMGETRVCVESGGYDRLNGQAVYEKTPGALYVTNGRRAENRVRFGKVLPDGNFRAYSDCTGDVIRALEAFAKNPAQMAAEYGHATGECCFCGRSLYDETGGGSVEVGYGPVCAVKYGLPHSGGKGA
jgi:hypothetical protein